MQRSQYLVRHASLIAHFWLERKALSSFLVMILIIGRVDGQVPQFDAMPGPFTAQQAAVGLLAY